MFDDIQEVTDGDYALVHLLDKVPDYAMKFMGASAKGRHIILDNSAYELGEAFNVRSFAKWVDALEPDVYVVPDAPGEYEATLDAFSDWNRNFRLPGEKMGVLQGKTFRECINCFKQLIGLGADVIGIPFLVGKKIASGHAMPDDTITPLDLMYLRTRLLDYIRDECNEHPIHLLGVSLPQEGIFHRKSDSWVVSVDTSNPVMFGMNGVQYNAGGVDYKPEGLLADKVHDMVGQKHRDMAMHNIRMFKDMWQK
jgi:hypothetical protein